MNKYPNIKYFKKIWGLRVFWIMISDSILSSPFFLISINLPLRQVRKKNNLNQSFILLYIYVLFKIKQYLNFLNNF